MDSLKKVREPHNVDFHLDHSIGTDKEVMNYYHFHNVYEIYLAITEGAEMWIGNERYIISPNDLLLLSSSDQHRVIVNDRKGFERYILYFNPLYIQTFNTYHTTLLECFGINDSKRTHCLKLSTEETQKLISLYSRLSDIKDDNDSYAWEIKQKILLSEILIIINEIYIEGMRKRKSEKITSTAHQSLISIMEYIGVNYDKDLNAQQVAELFDLNRHSLNRLFKEITGISFHKYLVNTRIIKAQELLMQGDISTTQACYESGFNDYAHFIRTFSNAVGISPGKYAKQFQKIK
ncbi:AraC family transcriptional regulator [Ectobacillus funiculus]|uniref:AraC family transcriptional regulator n=1 Tax=Ectobacillus funiculus TaxID=137993 RepID=UPI003978EB8D